MAYIANRPVRFDRDYKVGEVIPDAVIEPKMTRKLVEMGRILHVDLPGTGGSAENTPVPLSDGAEDEEEDAPKPDAGGEFVCPECGKVFGSRNALSAHSRSHKE